MNLDPNTSVFRVTQAVAKRGGATIVDLMADLPDLTRTQIHYALGNARDRKLLRVKFRGSARAKTLSIWEQRPEEERLGYRKRSKKHVIEPVASVWDLADRGPWKGQWPPLPAGRVFQHLEPWESA